MFHNYDSPEGYADEFYAYGFNADTLTNGQPSANNNVYMQGGYDFILRRVVGLDTVLQAANAASKWQLRNNSNVNLFSVQKSFGGAKQEELIIPELFYPTTGQITFDLFNVLKANNGVDGFGNTLFTSQVGFFGVRRRKGLPPLPSYNYRLTSYHYPYQITFNSLPFSALGVPNPPTSFFFAINNYDFELYSVGIRNLTNPGTSAFKMVLFNGAHYALMSPPILDLFLTEPEPWGARVSGNQYNIGSFVPPLIYQANTQIQVDLTSVTTAVPATIEFTFHGAQRIPV